MADTGKQSPLGMNVLGGILQNRCLEINKNAEYYMGISTSNSSYTFGALVRNTVLRMLVWSINDAYLRGYVTGSTYNNIISISGNGNEGYSLGNAKPPTYIAEDPSESWAGKTQNTTANCKALEFAEAQGVTGALAGPANAGYSVTGKTDYGQQATWLPYTNTNPNSSITQWGWIRCHALQAHNEFNWHAKVGNEGQVVPRYEDFCGSFNEAASYCQYTNDTVNTAANSEEFLAGSFSNMNDLITGDVTGVSLYTTGLAYDLKQLQKIFDFRRLDRFGFPSTLLQQLHEAGGITQDLNLALGASGLSANEIKKLSTQNKSGTSSQERKIYTAFLTITGDNLKVVASSLTDNSYFLNFRIGYSNVNSWAYDFLKIRTLADLLDPWYLFLDARKTLTVPLYNDTLNLPTGSKTYYLIYNEDGSTNNAIGTATVRDRVGTLFTKGQPDPSDGTARQTFSSLLTLPKGYDSYLGSQNEILPAQVALAAGALRYSFLQISNIEQITPGELGDCLEFLEILSTDTPAANGTEATADTLQKPVDELLVDTVVEQMGLGSGWKGSYRMDDFFGCMSGNPYPWDQIYGYLAGDEEIENVTSPRSDLARIYQQLFLAVSWEPAAITLQLEYTVINEGPGTRQAIENQANGDYQPDPALPDYNPYLYELVDPSTGEPYDPKQYTNNQWQPSLWAPGYRIKPSQGEYNPLTNDGGGYGRGGAPDPAVVINYTTFNSDQSKINIGAIGRDDAQTGSNGGGTFGRVQSAEVYDGFATYFATGVPGANWEGSGIPQPTDPPVGYENPGGIFPEFQDSNPGYGAPVANVDVIAEIEYPPTGTYSWQPPTGGTNSLFGSSYNYNSVTQYYINAANSEISSIANSSYRNSLNALELQWRILGKQMKVEQRSRYNALGRVEIPRDPFVYSNQDLVTFVDSMPDYSDWNQPRGIGARVTLELIIDRNCDVGQNIMAQLRQERNDRTLANCGIPVNNNIPDIIPNNIHRTLVNNGTVEGAREGIDVDDVEFTNPSWPRPYGPDGPPPTGPGGTYVDPIFEPIDGEGPGNYDPIINNDPNPQVGPTVPSGPPDLVGDPPPGNEGDPGDGPDFTPGSGDGGDGGGGGGPTTAPPPFVPPQSADEAIEQVIHCNCDCWDLIS